MYKSLTQAYKSLTQVYKSLTQEYKSLTQVYKSLTQVYKSLRASAIDTDVTVPREAGGGVRTYEKLRTTVFYVPTLPNGLKKISPAAGYVPTHSTLRNQLISLSPTCSPNLTRCFSKLYWFYTFFGAVRRPEKIVGFCDASTLFSLCF